MKKIIAALALLCVAAAGAFGQTNRSLGMDLLNTIQYAETFGFQRGVIRPTDRYIVSAPIAERRTFSGLAGHELQIDTPLEFALLSYYSQPVITIRPVEADKMLPADNPKLADLKLGAAMYQEIQILRFLGNTDTLGRHEGVLQNSIISRGNVTRAEIEAYYRNNIRGLVSQIVDEEFNKVSFGLRYLPADRTYNTVLIRNPQNRQYTISYERPTIANDDKTITAASLEALLAEMRINTTDFVQSDIDTVHAQAALIPAARLNSRTLSEIKTLITDFYTNPNNATYNEIRNLYAVLLDRRITSGSNNLTYFYIRLSYLGTLNTLNDALASKVSADVRQNPGLASSNTIQILLNPQ